VKRKPSQGYAISLIFGAAGIFAMVVALSGVLYTRAGSNPADAIDGPGAVGFVYIWPLSFSAALIFSDGASPAWRHLLRAFLRINIVVSLVGTLTAGMLIAATHGRSLGIPTAFLVAAAICQISGLIWLFRYSGEGEPVSRRD